MKTNLKKIFSSKPEEKKEVNNERNYKNEFVLVNWEEEGWRNAESLRGAEPSLINCISKVYYNHKEILKRDKEQQEVARKPYRVKLQEYISKNESIQKKIEKIKGEDLPKSRTKIEKLRERIREIKKNPEEIIGVKSEKAGFIIGLIIIGFLSLYLFVFYSSASYSAFFKEFNPNQLGVADSIFDPKALTKSFKDGLTELLLITTIPFVFLGLGYLIHKFQEAKGFAKYLKIGLLVIITFIFDAILAYEITHKIYNLKAENSFNELAEYNLNFAFQSVNFWLIIFAGFIVYLIWGFVFDFIMDAHYKMDKVAIAIKGKLEEIKEEEDTIKSCEEEINKLNHIVGSNETEIDKLGVILEESDLIKPKDLEHSIHQFLNGWLKWLASNRRNNLEIQQATTITERFLVAKVETLEINEND